MTDFELFIRLASMLLALWLGVEVCRTVFYCVRNAPKL